LAGADVAGIVNTIGNLSVIGPAAKFAVSFPLIYHYLGGVRHVIWDRLPEVWLENEFVEKSSYALFAVSGLSSVAIAFL
jgi:succinate dehydrogenase (ubiquinone) cytochrome b560 subunit